LHALSRFGDRATEVVGGNATSAIAATITSKTRAIVTSGNDHYRIEHLEDGRPSSNDTPPPTQDTESRPPANGLWNAGHRHVLTARIRHHPRELPMPLVRIDLAQGNPVEDGRDIGEVVYDAMRATLNVPEADRFQVITSHPAAELAINPNYLGIARTKDCILVQVTLSEGRTLEQKRAFYRMIADGLNKRFNLRREDVFINLVEVKKENWSFGNGEAQYT
jgi:4-oxalocrotonate tautomerase